MCEKSRVHGATNFTFVSLIAGVKVIIWYLVLKKIFFFLLSRAKLKGNGEICWTQCTQFVLLNTSALLHLWQLYFIIINSFFLCNPSDLFCDPLGGQTGNTGINYLTVCKLLKSNSASTNCNNKMLHAHWWITTGDILLQNKYLDKWQLHRKFKCIGGYFYLSKGGEYSSSTLFLSEDFLYRNLLCCCCFTMKVDALLVACVTYSPYYSEK